MKIEIGKTYTNKRHESYLINEYLYKEKNNDWYDVTFINTGNKQAVTKYQIEHGTAYDIAQRKKLKRIETELKLRERNRLIKHDKSHFTFPSEYKHLRILSLDLSTTSTGVAFAENGFIQRWTTIQVDNEDAHQRMFRMADIIRPMIKKVDVVIIEDIYLGLNSKILKMLAELRGMVTFEVMRLNKKLFFVPAVLWKTRFPGLPLHRKEQKAFMIQKFFEFTGVEAETDDSADAYMLLKACLSWQD